METLISLDKAFFLWLNGLGSTKFDNFWMLMTHRESNVIVYLFLWIFISIKTSWRKGLYLLIFTGLLILCTDQLTNLFKFSSSCKAKGYASNPMRVFISLTAALCEVSQEQGVSYSCKEPLN